MNKLIGGRFEIGARYNVTRRHTDQAAALAGLQSHRLPGSAESRDAERGAISGK